MSAFGLTQLALNIQAACLTFGYIFLLLQQDFVQSIYLIIVFHVTIGCSHVIYDITHVFDNLAMASKVERICSHCN